MLTQLKSWIMLNVWTLASLHQVIAIVIILVAAMMVSRKLSGMSKNNLPAWQTHKFFSLTSYIHLSTREFLFLIFAPALLWMAVVLTNVANWPNVILDGTASIVSAWVIIRLGSSGIKSRFWSNILALAIWIVASLYIVGWLDSTVKVLDKTTLPFGENSLSLLALIKGGVILALLLWLSKFVSDGLERVLWRSQLSPSEKVLFAKLAKVLLSVFAVMIGLNVMGVNFTALAVFSGALGIGIGFGLQKVFANLVSGFILLMDKSIKPGDVIAVANTYGWVNRLGARYVSILTRDGKEHLIPNETLITQTVENWSYSSDSVRIHIPIGVSYTSDVPLVKRLLLEVANQHPRILKDPAPTCLIKGFGDNSVDFEIRAWIVDPVNGIGNIRSSVYEEVWKVFKEHGVVVPFPQRDIHLNMDQMREIVKMIKSDDDKTQRYSKSL